MRIALLLLAACGSRAATAPLSNEKPAPVEDPIAFARLVVTALRSGTVPASLIDPEVGVSIWRQPGAIPAPMLHAEPGTALVVTGLDVPASDLPPELAADLSRAIATHDIDPPEPQAARYGDCETMTVTTGWLETRGFASIERLAANAEVDPGAVAYVLHWWDAMLVITRHGEHLFVSELVPSDPCDA